MSIADSTFGDNVAGSYGGAVYGEYGVMSIARSAFHGNIVQAGGEGGGAVFVYEESDVVAVDHSTFVGNEADWGGAIASDDSDMLVSSSQFTANHTTYASDYAPDYGGAGIYVDWGTTSVVGSSFTNNTTPSGSAGAGIHLYRGSLSVDRSTFSGNRSGQAPAIYSYGNNRVTYDAGKSFTVTNSTFVGNINTIADDSAAIGHERNARSFTLTGNTFRGNGGANYGGAVETWLVNGSLSITKNVFVHNRATEGGALWLDVRNGVDGVRQNRFVGNLARAGAAISFECETALPRTTARKLVQQNRFSGNVASKVPSSANVYQSPYDVDGTYCGNAPG